MHTLPALLAAALLTASAACATRDTPATTAPAGTGLSAPPQTRLAPSNLEELMEQIGPGYESLRKHLEAGAAEAAGDDAQQLATWFGAVEKFWAQHDRGDAVAWAESARTAASNAAGAAVTGNLDKARAAAGSLGGACKACHGTYREADGSGGYRIKPGVIGSAYWSRSTTIGSTRVARRAGR